MVRNKKTGKSWKSWKSLRKDQGGNVAMMFGLALVPMIGAAGVAIDYSRLSMARVRLQSALDAGILSAAKNTAVLTDAEIKTRVETFVAATSASDFKLSPSVGVLPVGQDNIAVTAQGCVPLLFQYFIGAPDPCVSVRADVQRPKENYLEVALVLDNSGSMSGAKIDAAKQSAIDFTNTLFAGNTNPEKIKISVVPFTLTVNSGSGMNTTTDPNLDRAGVSSIHWENVLPTPTSPRPGVISRFSLFSQLGETWSGCMEMRPGAWGLNDAAPTLTSPDSLFVPMFAPDEPGERNTGSGVSPVATTTIANSTLNRRVSGGTTYTVTNTYLNDDGSASINYSGTTEVSATNPACTPTSTAFQLPFSSPTASWQNKNWLHRSTSNICRYNLAGTPGGAVSARKSIISPISDSNGAGRGPNYSCNAIPLQRLTRVQSDVLNKINAMRASGSTNILDGFMWGWRTISPNAPYADARTYNYNGGQIRNRKYIILMTDGDNSWASASNPNGSTYSPFGYYKNNRLQNGITTAAAGNTAMNAKTQQACDNAKTLRDINNNQAIQIITIGFSTPGQEISADGLALLQYCASDDGGQKQFYTATNAGQLSAVFSQIAKNIGKLTLTR